MFRRLLRDRRGAVLPIFAIAAIPLIVATGAVVDYTNGFDERTVVQDAMDSAALAAGKKIGLLTTAEVKQEATDFFNANVYGKVKLTPTLSTTITGSTIDISTTLYVKTYFLGMIGLDQFVFSLKSQATLAMETLEVALVLDNSGSMAGTKIATLITAATDLTNTLYGLGASSTKPDPVKVALVPFAGSVNVGPANASAAWMDTTAVAPYHGESFEGFTGSPPVSNNTPAAANVFSLFNSLKDTSGNDVTWAGCVEERKAPYDVQDDAASTGTPATMFVPMFAPDEPDNWTCTTTNGCRSTGSGSALRFSGAPGGNQNNNNYLADAGRPFTANTSTDVFTSPAHGLANNNPLVLQTTGALPSPLTVGTTYYVRSVATNTFKLSTTSGGSAINLSGSQSGAHIFSKSAQWTCANGATNCGGSGVGASEQTALLGQNIGGKPLGKYGTATNKATIAAINVSLSGGAAYPGGPNMLCTTTALTPLTPTASTITTKIAAMQAFGITNITAGLMWGWRALSASAPLTEGKPSSTTDNQKIIVLMTDGDNTYFPNGEFTGSHYGAWGYTWKSHLGTTSSNQDDMEDKEDERLALACVNANAAGIKIYTIAFQVTNQTTLDLLEDCASEVDMAYQSDSSAELLAAFTAIGDDISLLRIAQ